MQFQVCECFSWQGFSLAAMTYNFKFVFIYICCEIDKTQTNWLKKFVSVGRGSVSLWRDVDCDRSSNWRADQGADACFLLSLQVVYVVLSIELYLSFSRNVILINILWRLSNRVVRIWKLSGTNGGGGVYIYIYISRHFSAFSDSVWSTHTFLFLPFILDKTRFFVLLPCICSPIVLHSFIMPRQLVVTGWYQNW